jgi:hypothetical protein
VHAHALALAVGADVAALQGLDEGAQQLLNGRHLQAVGMRKG